MIFNSTTSVQIEVPFLDLKAQYALIKDEILESVHAVLESAHYVGGEWVEKFEDEFARYVGAKRAIAVGSGTAALELALRASSIHPGDEVIVPANSFFATAEAVSNIGARPVFADVDPETFHLDASSVECCLTPKTRAIIPVHLYGRAADLSEIEEIAQRRNLQVIEDACQAHGSRRNDVCIGGSGRLTCFSFYPGKNLGAYGDAGLITCDDPNQAHTLRILRDHGSPVKYHHVTVGTNSRLDGIQAAILSVKLRHLDEWNTKRILHAQMYLRELEDTGVILPSPAPDGEHNYHLFVIRAPQRDWLKTFLYERGIETGIHYPIPLHLTLAYQALGYPRGGCPVAEQMAREILSLPMYPELTDEQLHKVIEEVQEFSALQQPASYHLEHLPAAS